MKTAGKGFIDSIAPATQVWWKPLWASGSVSVVLVDLKPDPARESFALTWLDEIELSRHEKYLPEPRRRFLLCRAALRAILGGRLGCPNRRLSFEDSVYGKPFARIDGSPAPVSFNVSHSGNYGIIAIAPAGRLGVDVEAIVPHRHLKSLIEAVMGPEERAELDALPERERPCRFYRLWTCKEALIKALGTGFSTDISRFQVPANFRWGEGNSIFRFPHLPSVAWQLQDLSGEGFAAALACELPAWPGSPSGVDFQIR